MEEEERDAKFRIVDRRRFTPDGTARFEPEAEEPEPEPEAKPAPADDPGPPPGSADFMRYLGSLFTNAMAALGALPPGYGGNLPEPNPGIAGDMLATLLMLQYKTRGNLSLQEENALEGMIGELKATLDRYMAAAPR